MQKSVYEKEAELANAYSMLLEAAKQRAALRADVVSRDGSVRALRGRMHEVARAALQIQTIAAQQPQGSESAKTLMECAKALMALAAGEDAAATPSGASNAATPASGNGKMSSKLNALFPWNVASGASAQAAAQAAGERADATLQSLAQLTQQLLEDAAEEQVVMRRRSAPRSAPKPQE